MSYPQISAEGFLDVLMRRKEFYMLRGDESGFREGYDPYEGKYLKTRAHQLFVKNFINPNTPYMRLHLLHGAGCHGADTVIQMADGHVACARDIKVGDLIASPKGPKKVTELFRGQEEMFDVISTKSPHESPITFICNRSHKLTVIIRDEDDNDINNDNDIDPDYREITEVTIDNIIEAGLVDHDCHVRGRDSDTGEPVSIELVISGVDWGEFTTTSSLNYFRAGQIIAELGLSMGISIPPALLMTSWESRAELLRGIISTCQSSSISLSKTSTEHSDEICGNIHSNELPSPSAFITSVETLTRSVGKYAGRLNFSLRSRGVEDYYGWAIEDADGCTDPTIDDNRYLLANGILTHNTGKTLASVSIAQEFVATYSKIYALAQSRSMGGRRAMNELDRSVPTIFVLGVSATRGAFLRELLKYPEFGFISAQEKEEFIKRQRAATRGLPDDIKALKDMNTMLKKRLTSKSRGGFYKFFGYDEFVNRLFISGDLKLVDLETEAVTRRRGGENITLEDLVKSAISAGRIKINETLLRMFDNSLLICDEIHETYNMNMKNNRGVAIQYLLDTVPTLRFVSLSATPINNAPSEIVELIGYLADKKVTKRDLFSNPRQVAPGKLEIIAELLQGKISFLQDVNIKYFPRRVFMGDEVILPSEVDGVPAGSAVRYLKFIVCPMSPLHQATLVNYQSKVSEGSIEAGENEYGVAEADFETTHAYRSVNAIPADGYTIMDMVFPDPTTQEIGMFKSADTKQKLVGATAEWKEKTGIMIAKDLTTDVITGDFLLQDRIGTYSQKYAKMIEKVFEIIATYESNPDKMQKMWIYHNNIKMSGVILIQELLRVNGFADEYSDPNDHTVCAVCGKRMADHNADQLVDDSTIITEQILHSGVKGDISLPDATTHKFKAARFVIAHSGIDPKTMNYSLDKFSAPDNFRGHNFLILVGSKTLKQSYDFKDTCHVLIMSLPVNIPTMIQVMSRVVRMKSHINLPHDEWFVNIYIFISAINESLPYRDKVSPELERYVKKLNDYIEIQRIERELNRNAVDANIMRDVIMTPELKAKYDADGSTIGNLYFDPAGELPKYELKDLSLSTFSAYKYAESEVTSITLIIKRLFLDTAHVWKYDELWSAVRTPPFGVELNPALFDEGNFVIALSNLTIPAISILSSRGGESLLVDKLFDPNERYLYKSGRKYKIESIDKWFIMFPVVELVENPLNKLHTDYTEVARDKERLMIKTLVEPAMQIYVDVESFDRHANVAVGTRISVSKFLKESKSTINYLSRRADFMSNGKVNVRFLLDYNAQFQQSMIEEAIVYAVTGYADDPEHGVIYNTLLEYIDNFRILITIGEASKYRDITKQFKHGLPALPATTPIGYQSTKTIRLFDPQIVELVATKEATTVGKWIESSKIAFNRQVTFKENDIIIGYLETAEDHTNFKVRPPLQKLNAQRGQKRDARVIERGGMCSTREKGKVLRDIAALGISVKSMADDQMKVKNLCKVLRDKLIENEIKERTRDTRHKYLYGWWDEQNFTAMVG